MFLPELPALKHKLEADLTTKVLEWFRVNHKESCCLEIKATTKNTIPVGALAIHQKLALSAASSAQGIIHKLTDEARRKQPFDAFQLVNSPAYIVCCFKTHGYCLVFDHAGWDGARYEDEGLFRIDL